MSDYQTIKAKIFSLPRKVTSKSIFFLGADKIPFAGINKAGVWMCVSKQNGKNWYSYMSSIEEQKLELDKLRYSEQCELAKELIRELIA